MKSVDLIREHKKKKLFEVFVSFFGKIEAFNRSHICLTPTKYLVRPIRLDIFNPLKKPLINVPSDSVSKTRTAEVVGGQLLNCP